MTRTKEIGTKARMLELLDLLCQDSLECPIASTFNDDYGEVSMWFRELHDLIVERCPE
jgi:hypothetical protein